MERYRESAEGHVAGCGRALRESMLGKKRTARTFELRIKVKRSGARLNCEQIQSNIGTCDCRVWHAHKSAEGHAVSLRVCTVQEQEVVKNTRCMFEQGMNAKIGSDVWRTAVWTTAVWVRSRGQTQASRLS